MKHHLLAALGTLLLAPAASAIIDTNNNGLGDLWERQYNRDNPGGLLPGAFDPQADPDADGWTNVREAAAGTDPFDPNPPDGLVRPETAHIPAVYGPPDGNGIPGLVTPGAVTVTWPTLAGKQYTLLFSPDLSAGSWFPVGAPHIGNGNDFVYGFEAGDTDSRFWRVAVADVDTDGDELTDWEEHEIGANPTDPDSDGDGLTDKAELEWTAPDGSHPLSPLDPDYDKDGVGDGVEIASVPATSPIINNAVASPDTAAFIDPATGLPTSFYTNLRAYWTFEETITANGKTYYPSLVNSAAADAEITYPKPADPTGLISRAAALPAITGGFPKAPPTALAPATSCTISFWFRCAPGAIQAKTGRSTFFALHNGTAGNPVLAFSIEKSTFPSSGQILKVWRGDGAADLTALLPYGSYLDDGKWRHIALVRDQYVSGYPDLRIHIDGTLLASGKSLPGPYTATSAGYFMIGGWSTALPGYGLSAGLSASLDRFSAHDRALTAAEIRDLYNSDSEHDTLADRVETAVPVWRDANGNKVRDTGEIRHISSPFVWDDPAGDGDGDGLTNANEYVATHTDPGDPDTDGDLMPDGWEVDNGLDPGNPDDATSAPLTSVTDRDGDGLSNLDEYRHRANPQDTDSDDDGADDLSEMLGPDGVRQDPVDPSVPGAVVPHDDSTDPNDPADNPSSPRPGAALVEFKLGVGDRSGSHSEDYVLNVFRIHPVSGAEERVYALRGGGHGQYAEIYKSFKKGETYTFQIQWLGTSNTTGSSQSDSADWDYHLVVEPQGANPGGFLIDSYTPRAALVDTAPAARILDVQDATPASDDDDNVSDFPGSIQKKRVLFYSIKPLSADRMFGGAATVLPGLEGMELHITQPAAGRDFGTHGYLLGGGPTRIYASLSGMLGEADNGGADVEDPTVWFLNDSGGRATEFYLIADPALGAIRIEADLAGTHLGAFEHTLTPDADFSQLISTLVDVAAGRGLGFDPAVSTLADGVAAVNPTGWATPGLIAAMCVGHHVENLTIFYQGLLSGIIQGLKDDWEFLKLIYSGVVAAGNWSHQHALAELERWRTDPKARLAELKELFENAFRDHVCKPLADLAAEASTLEGFRNLVWKTVPYMVPSIGIYQALNSATGVNLRQKAAEAFVAWLDDFQSRMTDGAERAAWLETPLSTDRLLSEDVNIARACAFAFGHTYGYLAEQVTVGAVTGAVIGKVLVKGGISLVGKLATRSAAMVASRLSVLKKWAASLAVSVELKEALERGLVEAARLPLTDTVKECSLEVLENTMKRAGYDRAAYGGKHLVDDLATRPNIRDLALTAGRESLPIRRASQLALLLGEECDDTILKNFMKVADESIVIKHADGTVDEFFEGFFRAFQGNPSLMTGADDAAFSISSLSAEGKATLKKFLGDPNPGKLWDMDVPAIVDNEPAIPHNYWVRGILGELSIYKKVYKKAGYTHAPTAIGYDFVGSKWVQIKTLSNPDGAFGAMKKAVNKLIQESPTDKALRLHILKKPGSNSSGLQQSLQDYINVLVAKDRFELIIEEFELAQ